MHHRLKEQLVLLITGGLLEHFNEGLETLQKLFYSNNRKQARYSRLVFNSTTTGVSILINGDFSGRKD